MPTTLMEAERVAAGWRSGQAPDSPAGPLFSSGDFAEVEIIKMTDGGGGGTGVGCFSGRCGTVCTGSGRFQCC